MSDPRAGLRPDQPSGNDAYDKMTGKGIYYVHSPTPSAPPPPPPPPPAPPPPPPPGQKQTSQVKVSNVNVVNLTYGQTPVEQLEKMYFQDVGGTEILSVARHDTVGGEDVIYSEVDNLKELKVAFNPLNILMSTKIDTLFRGFGIDITQKIAGGGQNTISMNSETGDMEIEVFEVTKDLYVQIQVASRVEEFGVGDNFTEDGVLWYNRDEE